jgi:hypothetical protein
MHLLSNTVLLMTDRPINQLHGEEPFLRSCHSTSQPSLPFMEPEGSLPCPQEPATGPYPEPDAFSSNLPTRFPKNPF